MTRGSFTWLTTRAKNLREENELVLATPKHLERTEMVDSKRKYR